MDGESLRSYGYGAQDGDDRMLYTYRAKGQEAKSSAEVPFLPSKARDPTTELSGCLLVLRAPFGSNTAPEVGSCAVHLSPCIMPDRFFRSFQVQVGLGRIRLDTNGL